jgi:ABC-2 type transport system permease protein
VSAAPPIRGQFAAIARLRWQLLLNGMRSTRGRLEIVSRLFMGFGFAMLGFGGMCGIAAGSWYFVGHQQTEGLAVFFWIIFLFWQLFPVMAQALSENIDSSHLLRYPLTYRAYFLICIAYGSFEATTGIGFLWLAGIAIGTAIASPALFPWAAILTIAFGVFNLLLARMIFTWIERWLAQRKTREIFGVIFLFFIIGLQFIGPAMNRFTRHHDPRLGEAAAQALPIERALPPGLMAASIADAQRGELVRAAGKFLGFGLYTLVIFWLLNIRLRAFYSGEYLGESVARSTGPVVREKVRAGWNIPLVPPAASAVLQKEFRYILRSGPMIFTLIMPAVLLVIFRVTMGHGAPAGGRFLSKSAEYAFPVGAAYSVLILSNLVYNSFGADGAGIQFYFLSPARFREILLGKNLAHSMILALDVFLVFIGACFLYAPPTPVLFVATIVGILYGLLINLTAGNTLSIYTPKKVDFGAFARQRASTITAFASLGVQAVTVGLAIVVFMIARAYQAVWVVIPIFMVLATIAAVVYAVVLKKTDEMAFAQRESLIAALCRP